MKTAKYDVVKEIKKLDKSQFYLVTVKDNLDFETINDIAEFFEKRGIKCAILPENINVKEISAESKDELLKYIKREISFEG